MRNREKWKPTKFVLERGQWRVSENPKHVVPSSRFVAALTLRTYERALIDNASGTLLDLGCGELPLFGIYNPLVKAVICADWSNSSHQSEHWDYTIDLNKPMPLESENFDTIVATDVIEHLSDPEVFMKEVGRLLRVNGKLILGVPFLYGIHEAPHDFYRYTEFALKRLCRKNSLSPVSLESYGGAPEVLFAVLAKTSGRFGILVSSLYRAVARLPFIGAWRTRSKQSWPLGYCLVARKEKGQD